MAEIPIATAVGWVVSPVIKLVIDKTQIYIGNKLFKEWGIEQEMKKMKMNLTEILSIMETVEKKRIDDSNQVELVQSIKDAVYDAEDLIDEFEYNLLEKESREQSNMVSQVSYSVVTKFTDYMFKQKLKPVIENLDQAKGSAKTLLDLMNAEASSINDIRSFNNEKDAVTSSRVKIDQIYGRQNECKELMDLLFNEVDKLLAVIPIVGQGGIGKTTLAQMIFNDPTVSGHFHCKVWLYVSDNFDKIRLTNEMLEHLCENTPTKDVKNFDNLQDKLEKELERKKILLVLDDVWYNKGDEQKYSYKKQWEEILAPLNKAEAGSKIILTIRESIVGDMLGTVPLMPLNGLTADDSWSLFKLCAFGGDDNNNKRPDLELVGKKIVEKLKGSTLAIKVVGTQLKGNQDIGEWEKTLCDDILDTNDIMNILHRSYKHLPEHLRRCFAYCSLFPKDYHFEPFQLVHMWIAQGFVHSKERNDLEDVGKSYFDGLLARSFFQVIKRDNKTYYVMHDHMNELASHVSKGECYRLDKLEPKMSLGSIRHLCVTGAEISILANICRVDKLRTLIFVGTQGPWFSKFDIKNLRMFKRIRVLHIESKLLNLSDIGACEHLRYLSLRNTISSEPDWLRNHHQLRALFIKGEKNFLYKLSQFSCSTSSLLFIDIGKEYRLDLKELVQHKFRRFLRGAVYLDLEYLNRYNSSLDLLGDMNYIMDYLEIEGLENVTSKKEAIKAQLGKKKHIIELKLGWGDYEDNIEHTKFEEVLEALVPTHNLEKLDLCGYPGVTWPWWLESYLLSSVKEIHLFYCMEIKMLPSLGHLPLLEVLHIFSFSVRSIGVEFYGKGTFPALKTLWICRLESLEFFLWKGYYPCGTPTFPELRLLSFVAVGLERIPSLHSTIILTKLEIRNCKKLITLEGLNELVSLERLYIEDCPNLLFISEMEHFYSLELLVILDCPKLSALPKKGLPVSLRLLFIGGNIHPSLEDQIRNKKGPEWNKLAAISECRVYAEFENEANLIGLGMEARILFQDDHSIEDVISEYPEMLREFGVNKDVGAQ